MEANEIKKALECCTSYCDKDNCPYKTHDISIACMTMRMVDALALITSQEQRIKELTEENERLQDLVKEVQEYNENWVADNGRLRGILLQFTDIVHKWGNKHGYDTSEISLVSILNEESKIKKQIREETIKEFQSRLNEQRGYDDDWNYNSWWGETINQIAKEMLEGEK